MSDDRTVLIRLLDQIEASPRPRGWLARLRHAWDIHQARGIVDWDASRLEGPAYFIEMRNRLGIGWALMWIGSMASALFFRHHPLTLARVGLLAGLSGVMLGAGIWYLGALPRRWFRYSEQRYMEYLDRARALPAPTGRPDPQAAA